MVTGFTGEKSQNFLTSATTRYNIKIEQRARPTVPIDDERCSHVSMDDDEEFLGANVRVDHLRGFKEAEYSQIT